jgi:hypothetical protein
MIFAPFLAAGVESAIIKGGHFLCRGGSLWGRENVLKITFFISWVVL